VRERDGQRGREREREGERGRERERGEAERGREAMKDRRRRIFAATKSQHDIVGLRFENVIKVFIKAISSIVSSKRGNIVQIVALQVQNSSARNRGKKKKSKHMTANLV